MKAPWATADGILWTNRETRKLKKEKKEGSLHHWIMLWYWSLREKRTKNPTHLRRSSQETNQRLFTQKQNDSPRVLQETDHWSCRLIRPGLRWCYLQTCLHSTGFYHSALRFITADCYSAHLFLFKALKDDVPPSVSSLLRSMCVYNAAGSNSKHRVSFSFSASHTDTHLKSMQLPFRSV